MRIPGSEVFRRLHAMLTVCIRMGSSCAGRKVTSKPIAGIYKRAGKIRTIYDSHVFLSVYQVGAEQSRGQIYLLNRQQARMRFMGEQVPYFKVEGTLAGP